MAVAAPSVADDFDKLARDNKIAPITADFDESKGVAGRVNSLVSSGSPLLETARTKAAQNSAKRGLMNSSIGVQAGEQAVIETATPIANADANLFQQQKLTNQQAQNNAATQNANNALQVGTQGRSLMEQARQFDASSGLERDRLNQNQSQFTAQQSQQMELAKLDVSSRKELAEIEARYKNEIQSSANISQAWSTLQEGISRIQNNPDLDPATKTQLIQNEMASFQAFSSFWKKATGGTVDVSDLLNFGIGGGGGGSGGGGPGSPPVGNTGNGPVGTPQNPGASPFPDMTDAQWAEYVRGLNNVPLDNP